jgi:hypothetical protein
MNDLLGKHLRLRKELSDAYSVSPWDTAHVDRLVGELAELERQLSCARESHIRCLQCGQEQE